MNNQTPLPWQVVPLSETSARIVGTNPKNDEYEFIVADHVDLDDAKFIVLLANSKLMWGSKWISETAAIIRTWDGKGWR
jgi:hypothetical protein